MEWPPPVLAGGVEDGQVAGLAETIARGGLAAGQAGGRVFGVGPDLDGRRFRGGGDLVVGGLGLAVEDEDRPPVGSPPREAALAVELVGLGGALVEELLERVVRPQG